MGRLLMDQGLFGPQLHIEEWQTRPVEYWAVRLDESNKEAIMGWLGFTLMKEEVYTHGNERVKLIQFDYAPLTQGERLIQEEQERKQRHDNPEWERKPAVYPFSARIGAYLLKHKTQPVVEVLNNPTRIAEYDPTPPKEDRLPTVKFKLLPGKSAEDELTFRCRNCNRTVTGSEMDAHARTHNPTSVVVDTTLNGNYEENHK